MKKLVYAHYDEEGVFVYQAFRPKIVEEAVRKRTFGKGFGLERTSWIKPSFSWTLRRSKYASKNRMQAIAKVKITHEAFLGILKQSIETHFNPENFDSEFDWEDSLNKAKVIHQWDPERDLTGRKLDKQAIQIGLRAEILKEYVNTFIIGVEDVTDLAVQIGKAVKSRSSKIPEVPVEQEYKIEPDLFKSLGCIK